MDQKIHIQRIHALINKMDKGDSILATFTTNELAQLTVLHFKRQIKFMSDYATKTTDLEVNLTEGEGKRMSR